MREAMTTACYLLRMIYPCDPDLASYAFGSIEKLMPALSLATIYQWREAAWSDAKQRIESV
jgi:hypothetical protein